MINWVLKTYLMGEYRGDMRGYFFQSLRSYQRLVKAIVKVCRDILDDRELNVKQI